MKLEIQIDFGRMKRAFFRWWTLFIVAAIMIIEFSTDNQHSVEFAILCGALTVVLIFALELLASTKRRWY